MSMSTFDAAFMGSTVVMLDHAGSEQTLETDRWAARASDDDVALFVAPCAGPTIDLGCGPGRLVRALRERGIEAWGVDSSAEAVRIAGDHGTPVLHGDIFKPLPRQGQWAEALLADGNVGIGGRPYWLLRRVWTLLAAGGMLRVEVDGPGIGVVSEWRQLRVDGRVGRRFPWAHVGVDAIGQVAYRAGFDHLDTVVRNGRHVAVLSKAML